MNPQAVAQSVIQKNYPPTFRVYFGQGNYGCAIMWLIGLGGVVWFGSTAHWDGSISGICIFAMLALLFGALCAYANTRVQRTSFVAIVPEGVVYCQASNINNLRWLHFSNIRRLELMHETIVQGDQYGIDTTHSYWLDVYYRDGDHGTWSVGDGFNSSSIMKKVMAACEYYWQS